MSMPSMLYSSNGFSASRPSRSCQSKCMELLYIWLENDETGFIREMGFNFSPKYSFSLAPTEDGRYILSSNENRKCYNVWKTRNIVGLSAVVGENGSGKSVLLRHLLDSSMGPMEYDRSHEFNAPRRPNFSSKLMIKIYRTGGVICIYHNFPNDVFVNHTPYQVQKMTAGNSVVLNQEMDNQTRIYMTNGFRHADSRYQNNERHKGIYFSADGNNELSKQFFSKITKAGTYRDSTDFIFLQNRIAARKSNQDFENLAALGYYNYLFSVKKRYDSFVTHNKKINISFCNPLDWFQSSNSNVPDRYNETFNYVISQTIRPCKELKVRLSPYFRKDPILELYLALIFELYFVTYFINEKESLGPPAVYLTPRDPVGSIERLLHEYARVPSCSVVVLDYYQKALVEIEELKHILKGGQIVEKKLWSRSKNNRSQIEILYDRQPIAYKDFCAYIDYLMHQESSFILKYLNINMPPRSSGEQALQNLFSWLRLPPFYREIFGTESIQIQDSILLLLDEVDLYLHPEWQRKFLKLLSDELNAEYPGKKIQVVISTHSPLVLSDIPSSNIIYLEPNEEKCKFAHGPEQSETFGANIFSLLKDSFFLEKSLGEFSYFKIKTIIDNLNKLKIRSSCVWLRKRCSGYSLLIERIGEPVVRRRLQMLYDEVFTDNSQDEHDRYLTEFERLRKSKDPADQKKYQELLRIMGTKSTGA